MSEDILDRIQGDTDHFEIDQWEMLADDAEDEIIRLRMALGEMADMNKFNVGDKVSKITGYTFPGIVVSVFMTTAGALRYVVELQANVGHGLLHIFNEEVLEKRDE